MKNNILETVASVNFVSQTGLVRKNNEDSLLVMQEDGVFAVMDGMGGASAGEVASSMVADCIQKRFRGSFSDSPGERKYLFQQTLHQVNTQIQRFAENHNYHSMGTTIVAILFNTWDSAWADVCYIGDSRCYCCRQKELFQLTEDHSLDLPGKKNILTNSLDGSNFVMPSWKKISICSEDRYLICSDGVTNMISEDKLLDILNQPVTTNQIVEKISKKVLEQGAPDNYSIICIDIAKDLPQRPDISKEDLEESDYLYSIAERRKDYGR